ncbi:unnamed protein product [Adineta ricciae]|uniref:Uncharacterized protein n=1 Tax=Adineta ricciae TaxID=249248 RepID=A0A816CIJ9_ADIRI|nr:unnamed protein product [Adineta ricciae]
MYVVLVVLTTLTFLASSNYQLDYELAGSVFPIPLMVSDDDDPHFQDCPSENGVYAHTTNCSRFHMCALDVHAVYSCVDRFFFNPMSRRCEYVPLKNETRCKIIIDKMKDRSEFPVQQISFDDHRKSATSKCFQIGIYPDKLDCSLFHYCREDQRHEILKCPGNLHFDPKTFMCMAPELVDCQYEPIMRTDDEISKNAEDICRNHPSGTYLPVIYHFDMYIICENDGQSVVRRCESGFIYNALTTACEKGPCTFDSTLCQNNGQCVDEPTVEKGFRCVCGEQYHGDYCEKIVDQEETTENTYMKESPQQSSNHLITKIDSEETTHIPYSIKTTRDSQLIHTNHTQDVVEQGKLVFSSSSEHWIKLTFMILVTLIGIILLASILFGIITLTRIILYSPIETFHEWKCLDEESNI